MTRSRLALCAIAAALIGAQLLVLAMVPRRPPVSAAEHYETRGFALVELRRSQEP